MLIENVVARMLVASGHRLFFYSQTGRRDDEERMEIDFLKTRRFLHLITIPKCWQNSSTKCTFCGLTCLISDAFCEAKSTIDVTAHPKEAQ